MSKKAPRLTKRAKRDQALAGASPADRNAQIAQEMQRRGATLVSTADTGRPPMSDVLTEYAEPLLMVLPDDADPNMYRRALEFATTCWNAASHATASHAECVGTILTLLRERGASEEDAAGLSSSIRGLVLRRRTVFAHDPRMVANFEVIVVDGDVRLSVLSVLPAAKGATPSTQ